jgi:hypothetical protein
MFLGHQWDTTVIGTQTDTNTTMTQQQSNGVFCAIRAEMLQAGEVSEEWS